MKTWILLLCLSDTWMWTRSTAAVTSTPPSAHVTPTEDDNTHLLDWLMKYGYLPPSDTSTGQLQAWTAVTDAVKAMQRFAGLTDTGVLDEETMVLMKSPRCSLPDHEETSKSLDKQERRHRRRRRRRRSSTSMWTHRNINWRLHSYPSSSRLSRETVRSLVFYALRVWSEPTPLDFHEVSNPGTADLLVDFLHGYHGDGYPFDGAGGAVGHAFFPTDPTRAGGVHLDAEEEWAFRQPASEGTDLFTVLVHEFGHALGLAHSSSRHSVMRPYYQGPAGDPLHYRLGPHDVEHITQLYGQRNQLQPNNAPRVTPETHNRGTHQPHHKYGSLIDRCNTSFDAVTRIRGETFFFKGQTMWRVSGAGLVSGGGVLVRRLWRGLPPDLPRLTAVLERQSDHAIIFISGSQFWLFSDLTLQDGFPQPLSRLIRADDDDDDDDDDDEKQEVATRRWGLVWDPEDGPMWGDKGEAGSEKRQGDTWTQLLQEGVSGITTDSNGSVFLFKGDSYWKFSSPGSSPEDGYPRSSAADWLDCPDSTSFSPIVDDRSLSLSPPAGRQELRERWREVREEEGAGGRREHDKDTQGNPQERGSHIWTQCACQNGATGPGISLCTSCASSTRSADFGIVREEHDGCTRRNRRRSRQESSQPRPFSCEPLDQTCPLLL
ncbi:matrix metalloproteinase-17b isoform X2 [Solea solea]|nr:matrix metalloproteinase-17b isoform X2 [Solea solea]XP_058506655.1 matrix metalloproteinase-17b isoform X2 [Solea solea]